MLYNEGFQIGSARYGSNTIKVALLTASYTPNADHNGFSAVSSYELGTTGTGYTAGGVTLTGKSTSVDDTNDRFYSIADDADFGDLDNGSIRYAVIYDATADVLIRCLDFGTTRTLNNGNVTVRFTNSRIREQRAAAA